MEQIDTIVKALNLICAQNTLESVSADMLLDCAVRIYATHYIQAKKNGGTSEGATEKQKVAMTNMNLAFNDKTTKEEAKKFIGDKINSFTQ